MPNWQIDNAGLAVTATSAIPEEAMIQETLSLGDLPGFAVLALGIHEHVVLRPAYQEAQLKAFHLC